MKRIVLLFVVMIGCVCVAQAQRDVQFNQYDAALGYYNPASAGRSGNLDVTAVYNVKMMGWSGSAMFANASMPFRFLNKEHGVGVMVMSDNESDMYSTLNAGLQYAFLKKAGKGTLRIGLQLGMVSMSVDGGRLLLPVDSLGNAGGTDEAIPTSKVDAKTFDANIGLFYATDKWYLGAAVTHLLEPEFDEGFYSYINRGYNFIGGYNIKTKNPLFELQPSVFAQTNFNTYYVDITAKSVYAKKYSAGLSWRTGDANVGAVVIMLGATFGKIEGGYAYEIPISSMNRASFGGQELFLKYRMQLNKPKTGMSKHKSVRIL